MKKDAKRVERGRPARCCAKSPRPCCEVFLSDGSIRYAHRLLRAALQDAVTEELLGSNPAKALRISHRYRPKFTPWTADEARRFLKAARDDRWYRYSVALALGLRRGEALALRWVDVDLIDNVLRIRQTLQRTGGQLRFGPVKTDGSERAVALPPGLVNVLRVHRTLQRTEREAAGDRWQDHGLLFTTRIGTPVEPRNINRHFEQLCERAGVRRIRVHDVLGHSSPTVTKSIYFEATRRVQQDAVDRLGFLFDA
ncbi:tyrosine-type recombinase/integrase [Micromonospora sp. NPDC047620]|uniref:tyrosine-type recombinase/integrase n=1 Tax=Micromonospora sp. NPDC047620 TaxID=3364251 RepID=UPI00371A9336